MPSLSTALYESRGNYNGVLMNAASTNAPTGYASVNVRYIRGIPKPWAVIFGKRWGNDEAHSLESYAEVTFFLLMNHTISAASAWYPQKLIEGQDWESIGRKIDAMGSQPVEDIIEKLSRARESTSPEVRDLAEIVGYVLNMAYEAKVNSSLTSSFDKQVEAMLESMPTLTEDEQRLVDEILADSQKEATE